MALAECGIKNGDVLELKDISTLCLKRCTNDLVERVPLDSGEIHTLHTCYWEQPLVLAYKTINTEKMICSGSLLLEHSSFVGSEFELQTLHCFSIIDDFHAPNLHTLTMILKKYYPSITNFHAPNLKSISILVPGLEICSLNKFNREDFIFFQHTSELTLSYFHAPLYMIDFHNLKSLKLAVYSHIPAVERMFPILEILEVYLTGDAYSVPFIRADNLKNLIVETNTMFLPYSIIPTLRLYRRLASFSFINKNCWLGAGLVVRALASLTRRLMKHKMRVD
jgi:hypothetical protein